LTPIQLSKGGGLGLSSAFRYHLPTRIILIQANNQAVSQGRLNLYLHAVNPNAQYTFEPVPREDAWDRFNRGVPRKLVMKIANPQHIPKNLSQEADAIGAGVANIGEALRGAYVTIEVSMGRKSGSLAQNAVARVIRRFKRARDQHELDVEVLNASVAEEEGTDMIDFLDEHLTVRETLNLPEQDPDRNYQIRQDFLTAQFHDNLAYLHRLYG
jgi:hypothetical protein